MGCTCSITRTIAVIQVSECVYMYYILAFILDSAPSVLSIVFSELLLRTGKIFFLLLSVFAHMHAVYISLLFFPLFHSPSRSTESFFIMINLSFRLFPVLLFFRPRICGHCEANLFN